MCPQFIVILSYECTIWTFLCKFKILLHLLLTLGINIADLTFSIVREM